MWLVRLLLFIIAIAVLVGFVMLNPDQRVDVHFPWTSYYSVLLSYVVFGAVVVGMFIVFVYAIFYFMKIASEIREKNRQIRALETELSALRNRSLEDLDDSPSGQEA